MVIESHSNNVYILSEESSWIPARLISSTENGEATVVLSSSGQTQTIKLKNNKAYPSQSLPLQNVNEQGALIEVEDMVDLPYLHEAAILYNLKHRHGKKAPYTRTGDIIIAVNPFQWIHGLYETGKQESYARELIWEANRRNTNNSDKISLPPHIYETSSLAYKGLACESQNQSILVSGESGAGKTETVKILMRHLASVQSPTEPSLQTNSVVKRVLESNPLLEAFGNAQTVRNDNSSRFGKFTLLQFHCEDPVHASYAGKAIPSCVLAGSKCNTYLLEKSRVVSHVVEERTYHIFYQLLAAPDHVKTSFWDELKGKKAHDFVYVGDSFVKKIEGKSDKQHWTHTVEALATIGVEGQELYTLMRALCIVLQLGNLKIEPDPSNDEDGSIVNSSDNELQKLADLMGVDSETIENSLTLRTVRARKEVYKVPLSQTAAIDCRDALAKEIYSAVFDWLVSTINNATCAEQNYTTEEEEELEEDEFKVIGLLDIFGFESFKINRFEQLCINYANEKLQQKFTIDIFRDVQEEYEYEGLDLGGEGQISFLDNTSVLQLVEGRMGIISVLNEECVRPKGNDVSFVSKILSLNRQEDCDVLIRDNFHLEHEFAVQHYAGLVKYDAHNFVKKNMDAMPQDLLDCSSLSSNDLVRTEIVKRRTVKSMSNSSGPQTRRGGSLVSRTVASKFKHQLSSLMGTISKTRTRYIRCIKPNQDKKPLKMDLVSTAEQLRCAGVVAAVTISRSAFPNRLGHLFTLERFSCLIGKTFMPPMDSDSVNYVDNEPLRRKCIAELDILLGKVLADYKDKDHKKGYALGKTRVYFRAGTLEKLEAQRQEGIADRAVILQKIIRGYLALKFFKQVKRASLKIQARFRAFSLSRKYQKLRGACIALQCVFRGLQASRFVYNLKRAYSATLVQTHWRMAVAITLRKHCIVQVIKIQAMARGALQRPIYREELREFKEAAKLENQVLALQRKLEEAEKKRIEAERRANEKPKQEVQVVYKEKEGSAASANTPSKAETQSNASSSNNNDLTDGIPQRIYPSTPSNTNNNTSQILQSPSGAIIMTEQQQHLMDESGRMLEYLRKEVYRLRSQNTNLRKEFETLKENNQRLMDANASAGASFQALNQHSKYLARQNDKLKNEVQNAKSGVSKMNVMQAELKEELKMKQATYIAEVHSRLQYQKTMQKIVEAIQDRCTDDQLVDDILAMNDDCESDYMAGPTGMSRPSSGGGGGGAARNLGNMLANAMSPQATVDKKKKTPGSDTGGNYNDSSSSRKQLKREESGTIASRLLKTFGFGATPKKGGDETDDESSEEEESESESSDDESTDSEEEYERRRERMTRNVNPGMNKLQAFSDTYRET